jgi:uncharacterized iron-regulated protein
LNQILDKKATDETLTQVIELNELDTKTNEQKNVTKMIEAETNIDEENIKELLQYQEPINLSDVDLLLNYVNTVTIKTLLVNLFDSSYASNHRVVLDCLNMVVYTLGVETSSYLHILVPALSHYALLSSTILDYVVLQLFEKILKACGAQFGLKSQKNIDSLMEIIMKKLSEGKHKEKCLDTLIELINSSMLI